MKCPPNSRRPVGFGDGEGLYLQVSPGDTKSWLFRYTLYGKAREMGLGPVGEPPGGVPLAEARKLAGAARATLREGRDPIVARQERKAELRRAALEAAERTFKAAAAPADGGMGRTLRAAAGRGGGAAGAAPTGRLTAGASRPAPGLSGRSGRQSIRPQKEHGDRKAR
jgi:hypothetical protein